jgi:hypothetical protein
MEPTMAARALFPVVFALVATAAAAQQAAPADDGVGALIARLENAGVTGNRDGMLAMGGSSGSVPGLTEFADMADPAPAKFIIKERDRSALENGSERLLLEVFVQHGREARITTWRLDVERSATASGSWAIAEMARLSMISGLYRLELSADKQFDIKNLTVRGPDLTLEIPSGSAFVAETPDGPTAVVLLGRGKMRFSPANAAEQTQLQIFSGHGTLDADFDAAFIRIRPGDLEWRFGSGSLIPRAVSPRELRRAEDIFEDYVGQTLHLDLTDLSRDRWSLTPSSGDLIAEVRTRRHGSLTYTRVGKDAEDISLFDRRRRRNISVYASAEKLAARGRFYSEDDLVEYDVIHHDIEASFEPERLWIDGRANLLIKVRSLALTTLTLRLAEPLSVRTIVSPELGRLLHLRVVGQNSVIVNLPAAVTQNTHLWLQVTYSGRIEPQTIEREAIAPAGQQQENAPETIQISLEPQWVYSNRSYWHPQNMVTDYATGRLRIVVPAEYDVIASGTPVGPWAPAPGPVEPGERARKMFIFEADRPARYFGCVISRFSLVTTTRLDVSSPGTQLSNGGEDSVMLFVQANPRQTGRARTLTERSTAILRYFASLLGDAPYPSFTLAIAESELPGGHSPPYFAILNQTLPMVGIVWRNDPVSFDNYPSFFLAHELAHQWWGQAIGWKNYHEQWISEGFAQYFAALYAEHERGDDLLSNLMRQMRRWGIEQSSEGPIYLGYRLGHIKADGRVFRALVYNKGAMVLHMLRRFLGDDAFFKGLRQFYEDWRFRKAGTDDFRVVMEAAGGRELTAFFEAWIYGTAIPELRFSYEAGPSSAVLRFEHRRDVVPVPVTVTIAYADGSREQLVVPVVERAIERTVPLKGRLRTIEVNRDNGALAEFTR